MAEPLLLSELCSICNKSVPKYRCPGCSSRTCSLPCYKLHQLQNLCDGRRDPTRYVKRSQLATPAGVDHDFNFLSGVERGLDGAERGLEERGVGVRQAQRGKTKGYDALRRRVEETRVVVERAPVGLSRQRANRTRWNVKTKGILWTVEWLHDDGTSDVREVHDTRPLHEVYEEQFKTRRGGGGGLKRKRGAESANAEHHAPEPQVRGPKSDLQAAVDDQDADTPSKEEPADPGPLPSDEALPPTPSQPSDHTTSSTTISDYSFYLLRPHTQGPRRVLIPLAPDATLLTALRDRVVLEFPTVVVLAAAAAGDGLPDGFVLEAEYDAAGGGRREKLGGGLLGAAEEGEHEQEGPAPVDEARVGAALDADIGS